MPELLEELMASGKFPVYTTGHSLGGGLAQLAAYLREEVTAAYTFNTSPATGWAILRAQYREDPKAPYVMQEQDPHIIRVTQEGEWLSIGRAFSNAANSTVRRSNRTDVYFDFPTTRDVIDATGNHGWGRMVVELHSIAMMACNLAARVEEGGGTAAFGYTKEMARRALDEKSPPTVNPLQGIPVQYAQRGICQVEEIADGGKNGAICEMDWLGRKPVKCKGSNGKN